MKNLTLLDKLLYVINSIIATLLLLSYLLPYISPVRIPLFAVLSLFVPVLIVLNGGFAIYWLVKGKKQLFTPLLVLIIGYFISTPFFKFSSKNSSFNDDIKIMTYNVRMMNHLNWTNEKEIPEKIKKLVTANNPDILLLQENYCIKEYEFNYPYKYIKVKGNNGVFGMAIYSKFPIIKKGSLNLEATNNNIIYADILRKKDTIRIYNLHLQSLYLTPEKENFGQHTSQKLVFNLKNRFKKQAFQALTFLEHEQKWQGKKIIAGDFNNTAFSWVYNKISNNKKDAFVETGFGFGKTFNYWFPMRIDFILTDKNAIINKYTSFSEKYSDHFPSMARINWKN